MVLCIESWERRNQGCPSAFQRESWLLPASLDVWRLLPVCQSHPITAQWEVVWLPSCQNNHSFQFCSRWPEEPLKKSFISEHRVFKWCISGSKSRKMFTLQKEMIFFSQQNETLQLKLSKERLANGMQCKPGHVTAYSLCESHSDFITLPMSKRYKHTRKIRKQAKSLLS